MTPLSRRAALLGAVAVCSAAVTVRALAASAASELGPRIGQKLPDLGTPLDHTGKPRSLVSLMGENGLVLFFIRSVVWCPFCQAQLNELAGGLKEIERRGYKLAGVTYEKTDIQKEYAEKKQIAFTLLSDPMSEIIDRYGLRDPQYPKGDFAYGVPRPIIFILDKNGVVKAKLYEETYTKRPPLKLVLETLDSVARKA